MEIQADSVVLGRKIKSIRKSQNRTQEDLVFDAEISVKMLSEYENGKREMSSQVLFKIADALMVQRRSKVGPLSHCSFVLFEENAHGGRDPSRAYCSDSLRF